MNDSKAFIQQNLGLVNHCAYSIKSALIPHEDKVQIGLFGLWRAREKFDPAKGTWLSYGYRVCKNAILQELHREKQNYIRTLEADVSDICSQSFGSIHQAILKIELQSLCETLLDEQQKSVINLRFGLTDGFDRNLHEVSKKIGVSHESVRRYEKRALANLKEFYKKAI